MFGGKQFGTIAALIPPYPSTDAAKVITAGFGGDYVWKANWAERWFLPRFFFGAFGFPAVELRQSGKTTLLRRAFEISWICVGDAARERMGKGRETEERRETGLIVLLAPLDFACCHLQACEHKVAIGTKTFITLSARE